MNANNSNQPQQTLANNSAANALTSNAKKPYHTPKVERHGSLVNLTQQNINRGNDGETFWADCTLT